MQSAVFDNFVEPAQREIVRRAKTIYLLLTSLQLFCDAWNTSGQIERNINNSVSVAMNQVPRIDMNARNIYRCAGIYHMDISMRDGKVAGKRRHS